MKGLKILTLGITFKESCPDVLNTKAVDVINNLLTYNAEVAIFDPWASPIDVEHDYSLPIFQKLPNEKYDAIVLTVAHKDFLDLDLRSILKENGAIYDVKGILNKIADSSL